MGHGTVVVSAIQAGLTYFNFPFVKRLHIRRTVTRTPEVMLKVLSKGGTDLRAVRGHLSYLNRRGELEMETDEGESLKGKGVGEALLKDWDLDLEQDRRRSDLTATMGRHTPKLVHKLMFSMPPGTPPDKVLAAVRNFAREEFALKHRYAMVLHTDEPHPHVHMVVKALSEQGERLNIRKATLRAWRQEFARHLRALGVAANATERAVRGQIKGHKLDGIYRSTKNPLRHSTHMERKVIAVANELKRGRLDTEAGKSTLMNTRRMVERGWLDLSDTVREQGHLKLSDQIKQFLRSMPPPKTENEQIAAELIQRTRKPRVR